MRTKLQNGIEYCGVVLLVSAAALSGWWTSAVVRGNRQVRQTAPEPAPAVQHVVPQPDQVTNDKMPQPSKTACQTGAAPFAVPGMSPFLSCSPLY